VETDRAFNILSGRHTGDAFTGGPRDAGQIRANPGATRRIDAVATDARDEARHSKPPGEEPLACIRVAQGHFGRG